MPPPPLIALEVPRLSEGAVFVPDAAAIAELFFSLERSSFGENSFDGRVLVTHPRRVEPEDISVLSGSFRAQIRRVALWDFGAADLPWLTDLGEGWDLVTMSDEQWQQRRPSVSAAIAELISVKNRGPAQATKLLHLKRPALVPALDSRVVGGLGGRLDGATVDEQVAQALAIIDHLRGAAEDLRAQLEQVDTHLRTVGIERTLLRILDSLLWCSQDPAWANLDPLLARWREQ